MTQRSWPELKSYLDTQPTELPRYPYSMTFSVWWWLPLKPKGCWVIKENNQTQEKPCSPSSFRIWIYLLFIQLGTPKAKRSGWQRTIHPKESHTNHFIRGPEASEEATCFIISLSFFSFAFLPFFPPHMCCFLFLLVKMPTLCGEVKLTWGTFFFFFNS